MADPLDLEQYYPKLQSFTFPTQFIDLQRSHAEIITDIYDDLRNGGQKATQDRKKELEKVYFIY